MSASSTPVVAGSDDLALVDLIDMIIEVHGYGKQGAGFGYSGVRGLNALAATVSTGSAPPVIVAARLRKGSANSGRGAARITADALKTVNRLRAKEATGMVLVRADSAYYGRPTILSAVKAGAQVSITVRQNAAIRNAIEQIPETAWTTIEYPQAVLDEATGRWVSRAEVAEIPFTAFASARKADHVPGRLVVRRIPDLNPPADPSQASLFEVFRFHAFFTTSNLPTVEADKVHRQHAIIEQVFADLKGSALAHLPSGNFPANSAWLVLTSIAFNLTRAIGTIAGGKDAKATASTIRRRVIAVPARVASSARRLTLHLPVAWPWQDGMAESIRRHTRAATSDRVHLTARRRTGRPHPARGTDRKNRDPGNHPAQPQAATSTPYGTGTTQPIGGFRLSSPCHCESGRHHFEPRSGRSARRCRRGWRNRFPWQYSRADPPRRSLPWDQPNSFVRDKRSSRSLMRCVHCDPRKVPAELARRSQCLIPKQSQLRVDLENQ